MHMRRPCNGRNGLHCMALVAVDEAGTVLIVQEERRVPTFRQLTAVFRVGNYVLIFSTSHRIN